MADQQLPPSDARPDQGDRHDRRAFLKAATATGVTAGGTLLSASPAHASLFSFLRDRPTLPLGVQTGDPGFDGATVWAKADRPSRMIVEVSSSDRFRSVRRFGGIVLGPKTDGTGKVRVHGLAPGQDVFYRVILQDLRNPAVRSVPTVGTFRTAPRNRRDVSFTWGGDIAGQGWGINPDDGGYRVFDAMGALEPDFFLCSGDTVYADGPLQPEVTLPDGRIWKNIVTPAKSKVAETLDEYRGVLAYNLLDKPMRSFNARVAQINQWDDHEVHNNWWPGEILTDVRYTERRADVLAARGRQAFLEYVPVSDLSPDRDGRIYRKISHGPLVDVFVLDMRTYRDPNGPNDYVDPKRGLLGRAQREWLKRELDRSTATWKVIANDLPVGLGVEGPPGSFEATAQGDDGVPVGREGEIGDILRRAKADGVRNIVFVSADVHNAYALHNDPARSAAGGFDPFWEFVAGPLAAGAFPPSSVKYDKTFGQEVRYAAQPPRANTSPLEGHQYFGHVQVDGRTQVMTVSLRNAGGETVFTQTIEPARRGHGHR